MTSKKWRAIELLETAIIFLVLVVPLTMSNSHLPMRSTERTHAVQWRGGRQGLVLRLPCVSFNLDFLVSVKLLLD
jgi:hypothetical protein